MRCLAVIEQVSHHEAQRWMAAMMDGPESRTRPNPASPADQSRAGLTAAAFASLLSRIGPAPERAGAAYEELRRALLAFFTWRGASTPEECADETLDRLAARLEQGVVVDDVPRFARGIARLVLLEHWRRPDAQRAPLEGRERPLPLSPPLEDEAVLHECLESCLGHLPADGRALILRYYSAEGRRRIEARKAMAEGLGVSESALRNRAQRLRDRLERCITGCLASRRRSGGTKASGFSHGGVGLTQSTRERIPGPE